MKLLTAYLLFWSWSLWAQVTVLEVRPGNTVVFSERPPESEMIFVNSKNKAIARGKVVACQNHECTVKFTSVAKNAAVGESAMAYPVTMVTPARKNSVSLFGETSFGESFGAFYSRRVNSRFELGAGIQRYDDTFARTEFEGISYFAVAAYDLWMKRKFALIAEASLGLIQLNLDFDKVNPDSKSARESAANGKALLRLQYEWKKTLKPFLFAGGGYNSLPSSIRSGTGKYVIDFNGTYAAAGAGLLFRF